MVAEEAVCVAQAAVEVRALEIRRTDRDPPGQRRRVRIVAGDPGAADFEAVRAGQRHESDSVRRRVGASEVHLDVRELYFMNSSCMKLFVTWFTALRELASDKRYSVVVHSSAKLHWQQRSFNALRYIADGLIRIQ